MAWMRNGFDEVDGRTLGSIRKNIAFCKKLDLVRSKFEFVQEKVAEAISGYAKNVQHIDLKDNSLYRARKCTSERSWQNISELWYNPNKKEIGFGRTNLPGQQILYLGSDIYVAALEVRANPGERVDVIECKALPGNTKFHFLDFLVFEKEILPKMRFNLLGNRIDLESVLGRLNYLKYMEILEFISSEFKRIVQRNEEYKITASLANLLWFEEENDDVIVYPSIASNYDGFNIAFKAELADTALKIHRILEIEVGEVKPDGTSEWAIRKIGSFEQRTGIIDWGTPITNDHGASAV